VSEFFLVREYRTNHIWLPTEMTHFPFYAYRGSFKELVSRRDLRDPVTRALRQIPKSNFVCLRENLYITARDTDESSLQVKAGTYSFGGHSS